MQKGTTYAMWSANRIARWLIKAIFLFPIMTITFIPAAIFECLCRASAWLDDWWWM